MVLDLVPPPTKVHNLIVGRTWVDSPGDMIMTNLTTGDKAVLYFQPCGWFGYVLLLFYKILWFFEISFVLFLMVYISLERLFNEMHWIISDLLQKIISKKQILRGGEEYPGTSSNPSIY